MRMTIGFAMLLAGSAGALAQVPGQNGGKPSLFAPPAEAPTTTLPAQNDAARERQAAVDKRLDARTRRAIGSVCKGCDGAVGRRSRAGAGEREPPAFDPAQAPLD